VAGREGAAEIATGLAGRRAPLLLLALTAIALPSLAFVTEAPNRLLSGRPVGFVAALGLTGAAPGAALALALMPLLAPLAWPRSAAVRWAGILGAGLAAAALAWVAGRTASALAAGAGASARTSLGGGFWLALAALLLLAADAAQRLRLAPLAALGAALLALGPLGALLASGALGELSILKEFANQRDVFAAALLRHGVIVAGALAPTLVLGVPLGLAAWRWQALRGTVFPLLNIVQTIPSIALFGLLMAPLSGLARLVPGLAHWGISGIGLAPAIIALVLYSLLPIVRNTVEGLHGVPESVRDAARGMGMTPAQVFWHVDVPLALPVFLSGVRITAVQAVGLAAVSALIGAGGLGAIMFQGLFANALDLVLLGAVPVILLAVTVDLVFRLLVALAARERA
jgi:osmoprotectant transport system permease protein